MALGGLRNNKGKKSTHCSKKWKIFEVVNICHNVKKMYSYLILMHIKVDNKNYHKLYFIP